MEHQGTKTIETNRLLLRKFCLEDINAAYKNWTSDERVTEFLRWPTHTSVEITERVIKDWIEESEKPDFYQWAIVLKSINEPIGTISVVDKNNDLNILHIGYCIGSKWWHMGITSEAFSAIIPYLFYEVGANRIEAQHDPNNPHSGNVMKKCGLTYEGTLRQADISNKGIVDACMYSVLKSEWSMEKNNKEELMKKLNLTKEDFEQVAGGRDSSTPLSKYLMELEHDKGERLVAQGGGSTLSLDPGIKYENEDNLYVLMREKQEMP